MSEAERLAERLRELLAKVNEPCPAPLPEQDSRVGEAMAARADDEARKAWRARVEDARGSLINAMPTLLARIAALEKALREIEEGKIERPILWTYREDGKPSKHDRCIHDVWMYETCEGCIDAHITKALGKGSE